MQRKKKKQINILTPVNKQRASQQKWDDALWNFNQISRFIKNFKFKMWCSITDITVKLKLKSQADPVKNICDAFRSD